MFFKLNVGDDELQRSVSKANLHMSKHLIESAWFKPYPKNLPLLHWVKEMLNVMFIHLYV